MKNYELLPTEENLIQTLSDDVLNRNKDIVYFYDILMAQEGASSIAIDGRWGSGKTFFVRQSMLVINAKNPSSTIDDEKRVRITHRLPFKNNSEDDTNCDLAVYYDAWENDNDTDPILSLIYEITKQLSIEYDFKEKDFFKTAAYIAEVISGRNVSGLLESLKGDNPIEKFKEQKDLSKKIKQFFSDILVERGNRLVVFVDELDRCKPTYAVRLLEQIKHYLSDDRVIFVFSVNIDELQHTIKHYYGDDFDACRYLDRFFDFRVALPPADMTKYYEKLGMNTGYVSEKVSMRIIEMYHMELRGISRFYRQVKTAVFVPTHENRKFDFSFPYGKAREFMLMYIVPLVIGLKIVDISLHDDFVNGKNVSPLIELFASDEIGEWSLRNCLNNDESFNDEEGKTKVTREEIVKRVYKAIFVNKYTGRQYCENIGQYEFDNRARGFIVSASSMMSNYADYSI